MLKKPIKFTDYNGQERTEDFYFNLTKSEIMEMELGTVGGFTQMVTAIIAAQDHATLVVLFRKLILKAYGVKSPDGREFNKSEDISNKFACTEAYSELFMELLTVQDAAATFVNGIIPAAAKEDAGKPTIIAPNFNTPG